MKKTYIMPQSAIIDFKVEGMLAASPLGKYDGGDNGASEGLSNEKGWSSDNWSAADED